MQTHVPNLRKMTTLELIKNKLKIDFSSTIIQRDDSGSVDYPFELSARDFLRFAKLDFKAKDDKGDINALTNAKRAIDCQIDSALAIFGISFDKIPAESEAIIKLTDFHDNDLPLKLKLIRALDFAPSGLISKTRTLRNKLEHYYQKPKRKEINEAIELAELFVLSIESRIKMIAEHFIITDKQSYKKDWLQKSWIEFNYNFNEKGIILSFYENNIMIEKKVYHQTDEELYPIIRLINNINEEIELEESLKIFLKIIKHPIPDKNVKLELI